MIFLLCRLLYVILFQSLFWSFLWWRISIFGEGIKGGYGEECSVGRDYFAAVWWGCICRLWEVALGLGGYARASHTPAPLQKGALNTAFLFENKRFGYDVFPLEWGLRGVLRRGGGGGVEIIFAAVWWGGIYWFWEVAFDFRWLYADVTHPRPLSRGELWMLFPSW